MFCCFIIDASAVSGVIGEKIDGTGRCNFPTHSCKFLTEDSMGAQNFNFAPKSPKTGDLQKCKIRSNDRKFCIFG